ncbi:DUF4395 domain-containing protein [Arthrobacter sp. CAU 1506]|uniref:DUF4395 family protein n=1 Tax=Arthrobacter sp. CAU 1506 TaxID=2560052 RepID=UPI0010ACDFC0|nr:DUF4395 family protein [Arthrobacter sp. CAU 1506]TJY70482.1 DUF4395 domain-containing protein [Arthrobacter sp. CAU 1506]
MATVSAFTERNLNGQGFSYLDLDAKSRYALPLRFTPALCVVLIAIGLALQSPVWLAALVPIGLSGALFPRGMATDVVYNFGVRHLFGAPSLPPTPKPRRFSYILSTTLGVGAALAFQFGLPVLGFVLGGFVLVGATILTTTLWCLGSWIYRMTFSRRLVVRQSGRRVAADGRGIVR